MLIASSARGMYYCIPIPWVRVCTRGRVWLSLKIRGGGTLEPGHFAMVMLGTPTRGTSLTVIWNKRYSIWKASRFQRANGPVVFTA